MQHVGKIERFDAAALTRAAMHTFLAFDTATERISLALTSRGQVWQHEGEGGAKASATFLPALMKLLGDAAVHIADLDAIAFGRGPGAFTGLRTACAVAQGLAFGAGKPVLPIDTLLAIAEDARAGRGSLRVWSVMDARMDEVYAAQYGHDDDGWSVIDPPMLTDAETLNRRWLAMPPQVVAGNALAVFGARLDCGDSQRVPTAAPRAVGMLALAEALWARGGAVEASQALPLYLRDKVAETTAERAARVPA